MKYFREVSENGNAFKRLKTLGNAVISIAKIEDQFLRRANKERVKDEKVLKMLNYFNSWDSFQELESYWF